MEGEKEENALNPSEANKEEMVSNKTEEEEKKWDEKDKETEEPSVETGMVYMICVAAVP